MTNELSDLQTNINNQGSKLDGLENEVHMMKEAAKKPVVKAKPPAAKHPAAKPAVKHTTKPVAKTTTHKKT